MCYKGKDREQCDLTLLFYDRNKEKGLIKDDEENFNFNFDCQILANVEELHLYSNSDRSHLCAYVQIFPYWIRLQR